MPSPRAISIVSPPVTNEHPVGERKIRLCTYRKPISTDMSAWRLESRDLPSVVITVVIGVSQD